MTNFGKSLLAAGIALAGVAVAAALIATKPKADERPPARNPPPVEVVTAARVDFPVTISTQGEVAPARQTVIAAEVGGRVISVSERFEVGERFAQGDVLFEIDAADYAAAEASAAAEEANARLALAEEKARGAQALRDWKKLGGGGEPGALAARKPQLESAEARLAAATAALEKAGRDLERTKVRVPYDCQIMMARTELGSFVTAGSAVAEVFSTGDLEVRLPVELEDFAYVETKGGGEIPVRFTARLGREELRWEGELLRTEGQVDRSSRSVFLVSRVSPDGGDARASRFLVPGLFVRAEIDTGVLPGVFVVPRKALYGKDRVLVVDGDDRASFRRVEVKRTGREEAVIGGGIEEGERIAVSPLPQVIDKMEVTVKQAGEGGGEIGGGVGDGDERLETGN